MQQMCSMQASSAAACLVQVGVDLRARLVQRVQRGTAQLKLAARLQRHALHPHVKRRKPDSSSAKHPSPPALQAEAPKAAAGRVSAASQTTCRQARPSQPASPAMSTHLPILCEPNDVAALDDGLPTKPLLRQPGSREGRSRWVRQQGTVQEGKDPVHEVQQPVRHSVGLCMQQLSQACKIASALNPGPPLMHSMSSR